MNDLYPAVRRGVATSALWIAVAASTACQHRAVSPGPTGSHTDASDNSVRPAQPSVSIGVLAADWARWPMPNPPSTGLPNAQSYDVGAADVVVDRVTGLRWQRRIGKTDMLWKEAAAYCAGLGIEGAHDWRLPTFIELTSLVDFTRVVPAIDLVAFPDPIQGNFWTSTAVAAAAGEAWYVAFSTGFTYQGHQDFLRLGARCLRSGTRPDSASGGHYTEVTAGAVRDARTGLTWQRAVDATTTYAWSDAVAHCRSLKLARGGWRLPTMKELQTLVDVGRQAPAIDPTAFPGSPMEQFWTSSPLAGSSTDAWYVSFRLGATNTIARSTPGFARCVR